MYKYISDILEYIAFILPFNFWLVFMLITTPAIIFTAKPKESTWLKISKLILVLVLTYIFLNLTVLTKQRLEWKAFNECQGEHKLQMLKECEHLSDIIDGPQVVGALVFSWLHIVPYIGLWEFLWRLRYRKILKKQHKQQWLSNIIIALGAIVFLFFIYIVIFAIYKHNFALSPVNYSAAQGKISSGQSVRR